MGTKILGEVESAINGRLTVIRDLAWGTYIKAGGVTQSGGVLKQIWKTTLKKIYDSGFKIQDCLILGLGGGSAAGVIHKLWPEAEVVGVDIDPKIVELGIKYLELSEDKVKIIIQDAGEYVRQQALGNRHYDLICVDLYNGEKFPEKFEEQGFIKQVARLLNDNSIAVFNRLYGDRYRPFAMKFLKKLEKEFPVVDTWYPQANVMFVCYNYPHA